MQSRLEKDQLHRRHLLIGWGIALLALILLAIGGWRLQTTLNYTGSHFNQHVRIYDIAVGGLTVKQAQSKVNQHSKNTAVLLNGQIKLRHVDGLKAISRRQTQTLFNRQHTAFQSSKAVNFASLDLKQVRQHLLAFKKRQVAYYLNGHVYQLPAKLVTETAYVNGHFQLLQTGPLQARLDEIKRENATLNKSYDFKAPTGQTLKVVNQSYGWGVMRAETLQAVEKAFTDDQAEVQGSSYLYGKGFSTAPHGYGKSNNGLGDTYIVVSISAQKAWFYRHGRNLLTISDLVTGTQDSTTGDATPKGVWYIMYKQSPATLKGQNDDGSAYSSPVQYWMPFTLSGCGFHDASWRTDWSKTAYLRGGSHGCINIKPSEIKSVWGVVEKDEPVIII